ncbi:Mbeg1-like protein [Helicobacter rodentium]|uniref:Mbeg1-like protein n=4 Tax=Helicobacter rodentium TaxID=59617 RepID=UPI0023F531E1|nr:Mbeg1-like protein [Helicobacter rodentium]
MKNEAKDSFNLDKLNGEFSEIQAKNFAKRYKIKFHQANTLSGFSATLFYDIQEDRFVVGFRGTELNIKTPLETSKDLATDIGLTFGKGDFQVNALKQFLLDIAPILNNVVSDKIIFVGHSLGGYLAVIAMQFCDTIDRTLDTPFNQIKFTASQVYTFNSPAIDGIGNMTTRILADLQGDNILEQILNPQKVYCVYDNGGIKLIASAQYGSSNKLAINTSRKAHSIIPLTQTLYFYSHLLELKKNQEAIIKNDSLKDTINCLNSYMDNIKTYTDTFIIENSPINKNNKDKNLKDLDFLEYFFSRIAFIMQENKNYSNESYSTIQRPIITSEQIIDFILQMQEKNKYILMLTQDDYSRLRKDCGFINNPENLAYKIAVKDYRIFIVVDKDMQCLENKNNVSKIYGYKSKIYMASNEVWGEQYLGGVCKIAQSLYFNGKARVGIL